MIGDSVLLEAGGERPDNAYSEVISRINEGQNIKGTRYELEPRMSGRSKDLKVLNKHRLKQEVSDNLK
jgi:hypothetical protein